MNDLLVIVVIAGLLLGAGPLADRGARFLVARKRRRREAAAPRPPRVDAAIPEKIA